MQATVTTFVFGLPQGRTTTRVEVSLPRARLTLHELIAHKIAQEVAEIDAQQRPGLSGEYLTPEALILAAGPLQPGAAEAEIARAQQAFAAREYMIVIDDRRVWEADAVVDVGPETQIEFIKILPLVGG